MADGGCGLGEADGPSHEPVRSPVHGGELDRDEVAEKLDDALGEMRARLGEVLESLRGAR